MNEITDADRKVAEIIADLFTIRSQNADNVSINDIAKVLADSKPEHSSKYYTCFAHYKLEEFQKDWGCPYCMVGKLLMDAKAKEDE